MKIDGVNWAYTGPSQSGLRGRCVDEYIAYRQVAAVSVEALGVSPGAGAAAAADLANLIELL